MDESREKGERKEEALKETMKWSGYTSGKEGVGWIAKL